jgi:hypothetical protein
MATALFDPLHCLSRRLHRPLNMCLTIRAAAVVKVAAVPQSTKVFGIKMTRTTSVGGGRNAAAMAIRILLDADS